MKDILQHPEGYFDPRTGQAASANLFLMKRAAIILGSLALVAVVVIGLSQAGGGGGGQGKNAGGGWRGGRAAVAAVRRRAQAGRAGRCRRRWLGLPRHWRRCTSRAATCSTAAPTRSSSASRRCAGIRWS